MHRREPPDPPRRTAYRRAPVMMSALVCPGIGQCMQHRWLVGAVITAGFLAGFVMFMISTVKLFITFYGLVFAAVPSEVAPPFLPLLAWFGTCLAVYLLSLLDVVAATRRIARAESTRRLEARMRTSGIAA